MEGLNLDIVDLLRKQNAINQSLAKSLKNQELLLLEYGREIRELQGKVKTLQKPS